MRQAGTRIWTAVLRGLALAAAHALTGFWSLLDRLSPREDTERRDS